MSRDDEFVISRAATRTIGRTAHLGVADKGERCRERAVPRKSGAAKAPLTQLVLVL
jgi:hypothetical protein